jgi:hypothetical protein
MTRNKEHFVVTFTAGSQDSNIITMNHCCFGSAITIDSALDAAAVEVWAVSPDGLFATRELFTLTFAAGVAAFDATMIQLLAAQKQIQFKRGGTSGTTKFVLQLVD